MGVKIQTKSENPETRPMLRENFEGGEAILWNDELHVVLTRYTDLVDREDDAGDDRINAFAVSLEDGSVLAEDEEDEVELVDASVVI